MVTHQSSLSPMHTQCFQSSLKSRKNRNHKKKKKNHGQRCVCDGNELMRDETQNTIQKKRRDRSNRGEKEEREGDTGNGIRQKEEKKRDQSLRLAQGRSCGRRRTRTHTKKIHARPATHTQRRKERQRRNVIHRHSFRRAVNPNWSRAVADERRRKERDKSDDCWDSRMVAADVACSSGRRDCRFSSPLAFFPT